VVVSAGGGRRSGMVAGIDGVGGEVMMRLLPPGGHLREPGHRQRAAVDQIGAAPGRPASEGADPTSNHQQQGRLWWEARSSREAINGTSSHRGLIHHQQIDSAPARHSLEAKAGRVELQQP